MANSDRQIFTVSQINAQAREALEHFRVWIKGEVSEFKQSPGWTFSYLTLKDDDAQIRGLIGDWVLKKLDFDIEDGKEVLAFGTLSIYEKRGDYQIKIEKVEPLGKGTLQEQLEKLKAKLQQEGLFAEEIKKPLPKFPERIGVISSVDGAAWKDFRKIIEARFAGVELHLRDVLVQGDKSPDQIVQALGKFNEEDEVDLVVITRGGGSLEDLWGFNDEGVARAIAASKIPVVSAVGHEKDVCISDLVADHRSSTPSNAAEEIVPDKQELLRWLDDVAIRIKQAQESYKELPGEVDQLLHEVKQNYLRLLKDKYVAMESVWHNINALSPEKVLDRGYSVVRHKDKILRDAGTVRVNEAIKIQLAKGGLFAKVKGKSKK
ncbi:exodeoxyribonuclease VII large subunit [Patescibacteria group bacterium]